MQKTLLIGVPCLDTIKTETVASLFAATNALDVPARLHIHKSCYVHDARNKIVETALQMGATHLFFLDSDMKFPPDGIQRLIDQDKDIIGGLYYRRQPPHYPTINQQEGDKLIVPNKFPKDKPFEVFAVATGFMMVKTEVFKKIKGPWFGFGNFHGKAMGEDVFFCHKAKQHGFKVWCDPTIPLGHVGEYSYDAKDYEAYMDTIEEKKEDTFDGQL